MKCLWCENDARYVNCAGQYLCGVCDLKSDRLSIRLSDVPDLLLKISRDANLVDRLKGVVCVKSRLK